MIPERAISMASVGKVFAEGERNILRQKNCKQRLSIERIVCDLGPVYTVRTKFQKFLRSYVEGVYTIQNGAYERNSLTAYSVGGHNIIC